MQFEDLTDTLRTRRILALCEQLFQLIARSARQREALKKLDQAARALEEQIDHERERAKTRTAGNG